MPALEFLAEGMTKRTGLMIAVEGSTDGRLPPSVETTLYRIVQEGLVNATKHARAGRAMVGVAREPRLIRCAIRDNGIGFDVSGNQAGKGQGGLGLIAVRERLNALGGTLQINSSSQHGTELLITIPLEG
jgi:signal transduction histidine kinase